MSKGVRKWGKHFYIYPNPDTGVELPVTHLCLDGGRLHVPYDNVPYLHRKLGVDIAQGVKNYLVECRTPIFKFMADLDVFEPTTPSYDKIREWIITDMLYILRLFYPNDIDKLTVLVCTTESKADVQKYGQKYNKTGIHLLFPNLLIDTERAMVLRSAFIQYFESKYGERAEGYNSWADLFDKSVYTSNGLRMVGCSKMERCEACRNKPKGYDVCPKDMCDGYGKIDIGRIYKVSEVYDGHGNADVELLEQLTNDEILMVNTTSVRCDMAKTTENDMAEMVIPDHIDWFDKNKHIMEPSHSHKGGGGGGGIQSTKVRASDHTTVMCLNNTEIKLAKDDIRRLKMQEWLNNDDLHEMFLIPKPFRKVPIMEIVMCTPKRDKTDTFKRSGDDRYYLINVNCSYCMNIQSRHKTNGVYFVVSRSGFTQKCFCRCETTAGRINGRCAQFSSDRIALPDDVAELLFCNADESDVRHGYVNFIQSQSQSLSNIKQEDRLIDALFDRKLQQLKNQPCAQLPIVKAKKIKGVKKGKAITPPKPQL